MQATQINGTTDTSFQNPHRLANNTADQVSIPRSPPNQVHLPPHGHISTAVSVTGIATTALHPALQRDNLLNMPCSVRRDSTSAGVRPGFGSHAATAATSMTQECGFSDESCAWHRATWTLAGSGYIRMAMRRTSSMSRDFWSDWSRTRCLYSTS